MLTYAAFALGLIGGAAVGGIFGFRYAATLAAETLQDALRTGKLVKGRR